MTFMQPQVMKGEFYEVDTNSGTCIIPADVVGKDPTADMFDPYIADGVALAFEKKIGFGARTSAPGFMDCTDWCLFNTEKEAWSYLIEQYPESFTWTIDDTTAHMYLPSTAAAEAMKEALQTIDGTRIESDNEFIYVAFNPEDPDAPQRVQAELEAASFEVKED